MINYVINYIKHKNNLQNIQLKKHFIQKFTPKISILQAECKNILIQNNINNVRKHIRSMLKVINK